MPVKKFEAKTIKEALALVKSEFGPDAVILAAKDMSKTHGLAGEKSVQVTAAISDAQLLKKRQAEQSLATDLKEHFQRSSASQQKQFIQSITQVGVQQTNELPSPSTAQSKIEKMYSRKKKPTKSYKPAHRSLTRTHYMDIKDEPVRAIAPKSQQQFVTQRSAAAIDGQIKINEPIVPQQRQRAREVENKEVIALKRQIQQLQQVVEKFQNVPQNFVSLHPGANEGLPFEVSDVYTKLATTGMEDIHITNILKEACEKLTKHQLKNKSLIEAWVAQYLMSNVYLSPDLFAKKYHVFIGGSGQGKTTTLLKMATQLSLNYKRKIAIVSLDNSRVGVIEQLRTYAQILNIPFVVINQSNDWEDLYKDLEYIDHVLVDTPSCSKQNYNSINDLKEKLPKVRSNINIHYVQSLLARRQDCFDQAQAYLSLGFSDAIFTHVDDSSQYGLIYNFQKRFNVPIHSFGIGPKVPEDYEPATREKFVDLIFNLSGWRKS